MLKELLNQDYAVDEKIGLFNDEFIAQEFEYLQSMILKRIEIYFNECEEDFEITLSNLSLSNNDFIDFIKAYELDSVERVILLLALCREISIQTLDPFLAKNKLYDLPFSEFGGMKSESRGFIPSVQTALFLLCETDTAKVLKYLKYFDSSSKLVKENIIVLEPKESGDTLLNHKLSLSRNTLHRLLHPEKEHYNYHKEFPAKILKSDYSWDDLVFNEFTANHLKELDVWLAHQEVLLNEWEMKKSLKRGYKALFYGPPGTGKTLTATLLGKKMGKDVYRVDLSSLVSKYIGETEKNLEKVFLQAESKDWILFFDEADSLFGKRTAVQSSNDRYANQGTSYLLQRIEECHNMIILASNLKDNFDEAFLRRFQSIIYFPLPEVNERFDLWNRGFSKKADLSLLDLKEISEGYELSGATIMNVIRYASLMAIERESFQIKEEDIIQGIRRENYKEGKLV